MIAALVSGTLFRAPEQRTSKNGKQFVQATLKAVRGNIVQWVNLVAFDEGVQKELLRLGDGDPLSAQGSLKAEPYTDKNGTPKVSLNLVADKVLALRQSPRERCAKPADQPTQDDRTRAERCVGSWSPDSGDPNDDIRLQGARDDDR